MMTYETLSAKAQEVADDDTYEELMKKLKKTLQRLAA